MAITTDTARRYAPDAATGGHALARLTGLEIVEAIAEGRVPPPPMVGVMPFSLHRWREGEVEIRATPEPRFLNLIGSINGGWSLSMLDSVMGIAAQTTLLPGETCPSLETTAKFVRPISAQAGEMRILGTVIARGKTVITLDGRIEDTEGKLYAHGASSCMIVRPHSR